MEKINYQKLLDKVIESLEKNESLDKKPSLLLHACCGPCSSYVLEYLAKYFQITVFYYNPNIYPQEEYQRRLEELKNLYKRFPPALDNNVRVVEADYNPQDFYEAIGIKEQPELAKEAEKGERCRRCYRFRLKKSFDYACQHGFDYFCTTLSISPFKDSTKINEEGAALCGVYRDVGEMRMTGCEGTLVEKCGVKAGVGSESVGTRENGVTEVAGSLGESVAESGALEAGSGMKAGDFSGSLRMAGGVADCFHVAGEKPVTEGKKASIPQWLYSDFKKKGGFKRSLELSKEYNLYRQQYCGCIYSQQNSLVKAESVKSVDV